jgi:L,D-transpeptidase catalytic domain
MKHLSLAPLGLAAVLVSGIGATQQVDLNGRPILDAARQLKPGEYVWAANSSSDAAGLVIVNLETQRLVLFRDGVPIAASTVSTGSKGHETPTGVFSILQKNADHYSRTYGNAPMPNMQRLTWKGVALHAGKLPGYPASHGCIRLPHKFSELLFGATKLGMTVVITSIPAVPSGSGAPAVMDAALATAGQTLGNAPFEWHPERSADGIVSVVISAADQRAIVMRGGVEIGSAPVRVAGATEGMAYVLSSWDNSGKHWLKLKFSGAGGGMEVGAGEAARFDAPAGFRQAVAAAVRPGSVVIVTPESLKAGSPGSQLDVIKEDAG